MQESKYFENSLIKGFLETSFLDWPGKVASVLFLPHCNFRCPYCHNHQLVLAPKTLKGFSIEEILDRLKKFKGWIDGIVISGGEPTLYEGLPRLISLIKESGFLVKLDTNGSNPDMLEKLLKNNLLDYAAMDVKAPLDELRYRRVTGIRVKIEHIRQSVEILKASQIPYEFRTTICSTLLTRRDCEDIFKDLAGAKKLVLQNFNPSNPLDPSLKDVKPLSNEEMQELGELAGKWVERFKVAA